MGQNADPDGRGRPSLPLQGRSQPDFDLQGYSLGIPLSPSRRRRASSLRLGTVKPIFFIQASMAGRSRGRPRSFRRSILRNPILGPALDVRFMIRLKIVDCVGQCAVEAHVSEPILLPQSAGSGQEISVRAAVRGVVTRNVGVNAVPNVHQPNHKREHFSIETLEVDHDVGDLI